MTSLTANAAVTIKDITLFNTENPGQIWVTWTTGHWILGVSDQPIGPLLNAPNGSVDGISQGNYWLFADPANLGQFPQLDVTLSNGSTLSTVFEIVGSNGTAQSWTHLSGSPLLSLGWTDGSIDLVGTYHGITPDGINDYYMQATLGIPEPSQYAMLLLGLGILVVYVKRYATKL
ncbi:PEP-CTERM sorting domain-containing protein [Nitrosomonas sp.]|uniref:PEP-CTERM sorting domain-containing protein n=1 Tax=Nitrosomonas sp. TaxID=42353 RepID=UPI0025E55B53|nr:PEP-CTERM sorting domain-containing protein [Nitrosomonas sp.]